VTAPSDTVTAGWVPGHLALPSTSYRARRLGMAYSRHRGGDWRTWRYAANTYCKRNQEDWRLASWEPLAVCNRGPGPSLRPKREAGGLRSGTAHIQR